MGPFRPVSCMSGSDAPPSKGMAFLCGISGMRKRAGGTGKPRATVLGWMAGRLYMARGSPFMRWRSMEGYLAIKKRFSTRKKLLIFCKFTVPIRKEAAITRIWKGIGQFRSRALPQEIENPLTSICTLWRRTRPSRRPQGRKFTKES